MICKVDKEQNMVYYLRRKYLRAEDLTGESKRVN